jgi:hypothetical protein
MLTLVTKIAIDFLFMFFTKLTSLPVFTMITFVVMVTVLIKVTNILWLLWLRGRAGNFFSSYMFCLVAAFLSSHCSFL